MIKLELTVDEVNLILKGLSKLPLELSIELFNKIKIDGDKQFDEMNKDNSIINN